jgi:putative transposase
MKTLKAYKYRIYPNKEQRVFFAKTFGCYRLIYNRMLSDRIEHYKTTGKSLKNSYAQYKTEYPFLSEVDSLALANVYTNLNSAYSKFFKEKTVGFPKFKKKSSNDFKYKTFNQNGTINVTTGKLKLPQQLSIKTHQISTLYQF